MRIYDIAFYFISFFILGVLISSSGFSLIISVFFSFLSFAIFLLFFAYVQNNSRKYLFLSVLSFATILGSIYFFIFNVYQQKDFKAIFDKKINFSGVVINYPERSNNQKLIISLYKPYAGNILATLPLYPNFNYGDLIEFEGMINQPKNNDYKNYLLKDDIFATSDFPKTKVIKVEQGSLILISLFKLKEGIISGFQKSLPHQKAAFLSGLTLGERAEFSKEFKEKMSKSGTTHLVALSGYNITIIVVAISALFGYFLTRKLTSILAVIAIIVFVLMTGAEASVVRAAIMGFIILLAKQIGRAHSVRNAIAIAAFIMILINPRVLRFDLGFQLSFLALIGIVYLSPQMAKLFKIKELDSFLNWKENILMSSSAQFMVLPFLILNFKGFSFISIISNILILEAVPITMFLGFLMAILGFISLPLEIIIGWCANLFLSYLMFIIDIFSESATYSLEIGILGVIIYYLIILGFIAYFSKFKK